MNRNENTRRVAFLGVMAALVFAGNFARIVLPVPVGGVPSFTLANILCVLSGLLLGPAGGLAAGIGSALYDLTNPIWAAECWITFFTKGAMGLTAGLAARTAASKHPGYGRYLFAAAAGCGAYYALYYLKAYWYNGILLSGLEPGAAVVTLVVLIPASVFNGGVALAAAPPLALALRSALDRAGVSLT